MRVHSYRNVHEALPHAIEYLTNNGIHRDSRNGPVLIAPQPVCTVYERPGERVLFWPQRDANPFFHLYESLWMLAGRNDVAGLAKYVASIAQFSDDGTRFHGAYGRRWRDGDSLYNVVDQLSVIVRRLREDPNDRRSVLAMWNAEMDLDTNSKDLPCNLTITFQMGTHGELNMVVFNRSNDIIWGCYGANAVHFSMLLEYMATRIGCRMGTYTQVSVNWHGYLNTIEPLVNLPLDALKADAFNPYVTGEVVHVPMSPTACTRIDVEIAELLWSADYEKPIQVPSTMSLWAQTVYAVLKSHEYYRKFKGDRNRISLALEVLEAEAPAKNADWIVAARQWLERRA